jgi:hypothetical protein
MKKLSLIALLLALVSLFFGLWAVFDLVDGYKNSESRYLQTSKDQNLSEAAIHLNILRDTEGKIKLHALITIAAALLGAILAFLSTKKKAPLGWPAFALSIVGLLTGAYLFLLIS